jgi:hypothetical protein
LKNRFSPLRLFSSVVREVVCVGDDVRDADDVDLLAQEAPVTERLKDQATASGRTR